MVSTEKSLTQPKFLRYKQLHIDRKQGLVAHWQKVDDKLICRWVTR